MLSGPMSIKIIIYNIPGSRKLLAFAMWTFGISPISILFELCFQSGNLPSWLIIVLLGIGMILECPLFVVYGEGA